MEPDDKTLPPDGSIDAGLIVLGIVKPRGASYTQEEIAIACGCSRGYIWLLEKTAMEKMRKRFQRLREEGRISEEWFE
jgi:transcriptional regulator